MSRKVILYIAMSLDGFIAKKDDSVDFLSVVDASSEDFGYEDFKKNVDTVIWGRRTYDKVLRFDGPLPHKDKKVYVISRSKTGTEGRVEYNNNVVQLIQDLKSQPGKDIYCDGGGEIVFELLKHSLIDRFIISVVPHLVGSGIRLFKDARPEQHLRFKQSITYPTGLVQLWYDRKGI